MKSTTRIAAYVALSALACTSFSAFADDHAYTEGQIVNVTRIRTVDGKFDDYMKWVDTTWKQQQEAENQKKEFSALRLLQKHSVLVPAVGLRHHVPPIVVKSRSWSINAGTRANNKMLNNS
jgi:hypothetical protein